jgi:hypothetical protein
MDVFLSRLSYLTAQHELEELIRCVLAKKFHIPFTDEPKLVRCTVLEALDEYGNTECHGLIKITPDTAAQWFMKNCREVKLHNKRLLPHRYVIRNSSWKPPYENDKRRSSLKKKIKRGGATFIQEGLDIFKTGH